MKYNETKTCLGVARGGGMALVSIGTMQVKRNIHRREETKITQGGGSQEVTPCWEGGSGRQHSHHHASLPEETLSVAPRGTVWRPQAFPATDPPTEAPLCY